VGTKGKDGRTDSGDEAASEKDEKAEGDGTPSKAAHPEAAAGDSQAKKESRWSKLGSETRIAVISAIAVFFVGAIFTPAGHWTSGAFDEVHDFFLGYPGQELDSVKEAVESRPFWQEGPSFQDGAFSYLEKNDHEEEVVSTLAYGSTRALAITIDELVNNAPDYEGVPLIIVGREFEESPIEIDDDSVIPLISREVVLTGNDRYAYLGTASYSPPWRGLVAYVGILAATGRAFHEGFPEGVPTAYFFGVEGVSVNPNDPALRPTLKALAPDEFR
jgi:hypothetical protein